MNDKRPDGPQGNGKARDPDLDRLAALDEDQTAAATDQVGSDSDQTAADSGQTGSDSDQTRSDTEQIASDRDQAASDRDQAASDRDLGGNPSADAQATHDVGAADRLAGTKERKQAWRSRMLAAEDRARNAEIRDEAARRRDHSAQSRDSAASRRDTEASQLEANMKSRGVALHAALQQAAQARTRAAEDRARAAGDRKLAAGDRDRASEERTIALTELRKAHLDELTGAFRRGAGEDALEAEIQRSRREETDLVLAFVDIDSLKQVNDERGHGVGDDLLRDVVNEMRSEMRPYDPIVRFGGDEFVCTISNLPLDQVTERFESVRSALSEKGWEDSISAGLAGLRDADSLGDLVGRADTAMLEGRRDSGPGVYPQPI